MSFLGELKRRKVFQVAVVYAVVGWLLVQIAVSVEAPLNLPGWVDTLVIVLVAVGFPIALVLSWAYDVSPGGIVRTKDLPAAEAAEPRAAPEPKPEHDDVLPNSVAVLPFENLSPDPDQAYFAAGVHEEILNQLAKIQDLRVIARTSVMRYEGARRAISEIARELRVGTLMEGSVRYAGNRVRVTAQLIDAETDDHLWSEVYERDLADVFEIQADIATRIARALEAKFSSAEQQRVEQRPTRSAEAYVLYLQAIAALHRTNIDEATAYPEILDTLKSRLREAIAADPDFALAYAQRARVHASLLRFDIGTDETYKARRMELENLALADLEKALALDPNVGIAHETLALIHQGNWRAGEAGRAYDEAMRLRPNDPLILGQAAVFDAVQGDRDRAIGRSERAVALDPSSGSAHYYAGIVYMQVGNPDSGLIHYRQAVELVPDSMSFRLNLALLERMMGNTDAALEHARISEQLIRGSLNPAGLGLTAQAYGAAGDKENAARLLEQIESLAKTRRVASAVRVLGHLGVGDEARALHWLEVMAENREPHEAYFGVLSLKANWYGDPILAKPEFAAVRRKLAFQNE